jgi:hypothetical protein
MFMAGRTVTAVPLGPVRARHDLSGHLAPGRSGSDHPNVADGLDPEDVRSIILALMRIEEKLDELLGEEYDDGEEEADA